MTCAVFQAVVRSNSPPTDITLSKTNVDENKPDGTTVGALTTTDDDVGQDHTYTLVSNPDGAFSLSGSTIVTSLTFNYEVKNR